MRRTQWNYETLDRAEWHLRIAAEALEFADALPSKKKTREYLDEAAKNINSAEALLWDMANTVLR